MLPETVPLQSTSQLLSTYNLKNGRHESSQQGSFAQLLVDGLTVEVVGVVIFDSNRRANSRMVAHSQVIVEAAETQLAPQSFRCKLLPLR